MGRAAGDRMLMHSEGRPGRLREAVAFLRAGIADAAACAPASECRQAHASLLLALRLLGAPARELEGALREARTQLPELLADWPDVWSIHVQLPGIRHKAFWEPSEVPWLAAISARQQEILGELDSYIAATGKKAWARQPESGFLAGGHATWNSVELAMRGQWNEELCKTHFEALCALLRPRPELDPERYRPPAGARGVPEAERAPPLMANIYQALPGATIRAHFGSHCRLVASLGLRVPPRGAAALRAGRERRPWEDGQWLLFDDSYEHEVANGGSEPRYVLAVAMLHPDCCAGCGP